MKSITRLGYRLLKREFGEDAATQFSALLDENERLQDELDDMAEEREQLEAEVVVSSGVSSPSESEETP